MVYKEKGARADSARFTTEHGKFIFIRKTTGGNPGRRKRSKTILQKS